MTTPGELSLAGKVSLRAAGRKLVLAKRAGESERHVLLKALVFGLYARRYPDLSVERAIGQRYKPDLVALDETGRPVFWAECGETGKAKIEHLVRAYPDTHLVVAKQVPRIDPYRDLIRRALDGVRRRAPVELLNVPADAARFIEPGGSVRVTFADVELIRFPASPAAPAPIEGGDRDGEEVTRP